MATAAYQKCPENAENLTWYAKTIGWHLDETKGRQISGRFQIIGYAETRAEGLRMLAEYNQNPYDVTLLLNS